MNVGSDEIGLGKGQACLPARQGQGNLLHYTFAKARVICGKASEVEKKEIKRK